MYLVIRVNLLSCHRSKRIDLLCSFILLYNLKSKTIVIMNITLDVINIVYIASVVQGHHFTIYPAKPRVPGRPRLGCMDGVKVTLGNRGMTVEAAR